MILTNESCNLRISVIVCTLGRKEQLSRCLEALARQRYPCNQYEVIVVENCQRIHNKAANEIKRLVFSNLLEHISYFHCSQSGLSNARNVGLLHGQGEILCFIDDDALAPPEWLTIMDNAYRKHPQAGVIGGHILLEIPKPRPKILRPGYEIFWSQLLTNFTEFTEVELWHEFPWGANWSARKSALNQIGGFKRTYGRRGENYWGGEELVAAYEIRKLGYSIGIEPKSVVLHCVNPSRFSFVYLFRTILSEQFVRYQAQKDGYVALDKNDISIAKIRKQHLLPLSIKIMARLIVSLYKIIDGLRQK